MELFAFFFFSFFPMFPTHSYDLASFHSMIPEKHIQTHLTESQPSSFPFFLFVPERTSHRSCCSSAFLPSLPLHQSVTNSSSSFMSLPNEDSVSSSSDSQVSDIFGDLLDSIIVDVASECHRIAKLGLDRNFEEEEEEMRLSAQARVRVADPSNSAETNSKYVVDIFGQTHPPVANEIFECMNCGRTIMAGRFAPHLEKCMGKGRKARPKVTRSSTAAQTRHTRGNPVSTYSTYSNSNSTSRMSNGTSSVAGEEYSNGALEEQ